MKSKTNAGMLLSALCVLLTAAQAQMIKPPLTRIYHEGETLRYQMTAVNEQWHYTIQLDCVVKKAADGPFHEEVLYSQMTSDGKPHSASRKAMDCITSSACC